MWSRSGAVDQSIADPKVISRRRRAEMVNRLAWLYEREGKGDRGPGDGLVGWLGLWMGGAGR